MVSMLPIKLCEELQLCELNLKPVDIKFSSVTLDSDRFICVVEKNEQDSQAVIIDLKDTSNPIRRPISANGANVNPVSKIIALRSKTSQENTTFVQVVNLELKCVLKSYTMSGEISFMKWISENTLAIITNDAVFHWSLEGDSIPVKMFERNVSLKNYQIINYGVDSRLVWFVLSGISCENDKVVGKMQLYSLEKKCSQIIDGFSACFTQFKFEGNKVPSNIISFVGTAGSMKLYIMELGLPPAGNSPVPKRTVDIMFPPEAAGDFPVTLQPTIKYGMLYLITKLGYLYIYDIESISCIYFNRITSDTIFVTATREYTGGIIGISRKGQVLSVTLDENNIIPYVKNILQNCDLALRLASRYNLPGADDFFLAKFNESFLAKNYPEAAKIAARAPRGILRTPEILRKFQDAEELQAQHPPMLQYFCAIMETGVLNKHESFEICRLALHQGKKNLIEEWLKQNKLECSEELGDLLKKENNVLALTVYLRASVPSKVVQCFVENEQFDKLVQYAQKVNFTPDYSFLLRNVVSRNPVKAVEFAKSIIQSGQSPIDLHEIAEIFMEKSLVQQCTAFLLDALKRNSPEDAELQTKILEINLLSAPQVADAILGNKMFSFYNKKYIGTLCEKAGLFCRALENYTDLEDVKRVLSKSVFIDIDWLVAYFGNFSVEDSLDCLHVLMKSDPKNNLRVCLNIAEKYYRQLSVERIVALFESCGSSEGIFCFLGSIINSVQDAEINFKYIIAACHLGQWNVVEQICRYSNNFDPNQVKNFLKDSSANDYAALMVVCDRFNFLQDLINFLYQQKLFTSIEAFVHNINPSRLPIVTGILLDMDCPEDFIMRLVMDSNEKFSFEELVNEFEKRTRLSMLSPWLDRKAQGGCTVTAVHNALAMIRVDLGNNPESFLKENAFYDCSVVGKYCEKRDPYLAGIAYEKGGCSEELISLYSENALYKQAAKYLIKKRDPILWNKVLGENNSFKKNVVEHIINSVMAEVIDPEEVKETVKAFMSANLPKDLIKILDVLLSDRSTFSGESNLQNLVILTAMKVDQPLVMKYIDKLNNYSADEIAIIATNSGLYEEALAIYKKHNLNSCAMEILVRQMGDLEKGLKLAEECNEESVWYALGEAQLSQGAIKEAIRSFVRANNPCCFEQVISAAQKAEEWVDLADYLQFASKILKDPLIQNELLFAYAKTNKLTELLECIISPYNADLNSIGDRCFESGLYSAAEMLYSNNSNFPKLALTLIQLKNFKGAVEAAGKAKRLDVWKDLCQACLRNEEFKLAQTCALHIIVHAEELEKLSTLYEEYGYIDQLISVLETGLTQERVHMGLFTKLAILYSDFRPWKVMEHLELFWSRLKIPEVIKATLGAHLWKESIFLYEKYDDYDSAISLILEHPTETWNEIHFKDIILKTANSELYNKAINFYLEFKPLNLNDFLIAISSKIENSKTVSYLASLGHLKLVKNYLVSIQYLNDKIVNESLNSLYIEEEDFEALRGSICSFDNFDSRRLAAELEDHAMVEFRRIAVLLYRQNKMWTKCMEVCRSNGLLEDAVECGVESECGERCEELLAWLGAEGKADWFAAGLLACYHLVRPDVVLEMAWGLDLWHLALPYFIQVVREYVVKVDALERAQTSSQPALPLQPSQVHHLSLEPPQTEAIVLRSHYK